MVKRVWRFGSLLVEEYEGVMPRETVTLTILDGHRTLSAMLSLNDTLELFKILAEMALRKLEKAREEKLKAYKKAWEEVRYDEKRLQQAKEKGLHVEQYEGPYKRSVEWLAKVDAELKLLNEQADVLERLAAMPVEPAKEEV